MPDKRKHRGSHPDDATLFAADQLPALRTAVAEFSWLLTRGYAPDSGLKLVGDRHGLTARQRMAVRRSACRDEAVEKRAAAHVPSDALAGGNVAVDGYNLLITIESALAGGVILRGRDGGLRDLASVHGTYRKVSETVPAVELIVRCLRNIGVAGVDWYLDQPVSNSGRLKTLMAHVIEAMGEFHLTDDSGPSACDPRTEKGAFQTAASGGARPTDTRSGVARRTHGNTQSAGDRCTVWNIELSARPDELLIAHGGVVVSSDSVVLDRCRAWTNLAGHIIDRHVGDAWVIDLR